MTHVPAQEIVGMVQATLLGQTSGTIATLIQEKVSAVIRHGFKGDSHAGPRLADVREKALTDFGLPKGLEIINNREFSAVSTEELDQIAKNMGIPMIPFGYLGENLVLSGIPRLSLLPPGTQLFFRKNARELRTAVLLVTGENTPCRLPGDMIQGMHPDKPKLAGSFVKHAMGLRGIVGQVFASGRIAPGDEVVVKIPTQRVYLATE